MDRKGVCRRAKDLLSPNAIAMPAPLSQRTAESSAATAPGQLAAM